MRRIHPWIDIHELRPYPVWMSDQVFVALTAQRRLLFRLFNSLSIVLYGKDVVWWRAKQPLNPHLSTYPYGYAVGWLG